MMVVADTSYYLVSVPVQWAQSTHLVIGSDVEIYDPTTDQRLEGKLLRREKFVRNFSGKPGVIVIAAVQPNEDAPVIFPGSLVECSIKAEKVRLREFIRRFLKSGIS